MPHAPLDVGTGGAYSMDLTLPGLTTIPIGGLIGVLLGLLGGGGSILAVPALVFGIPGDTITAINGEAVKPEEYWKLDRAPEPRVQDGRLVYGLGALKNVGVDAMELIVRGRGSRPFATVFDMARKSMMVG